jgi:hypothetical protein
VIGTGRHFIDQHNFYAFATFITPPVLETFHNIELSIRSLRKQWKPLIAPFLLQCSPCVVPWSFTMNQSMFRSLEEKHEMKWKEGRGAN